MINKTDMAPVLGVIKLDTRFPRLPGDIGNPETFDFPVLYQTVPGASPERVVVEQDRELLQPFIDAGIRLVSEGATIITTSCGFLACFQNELQDALPIPVYTSSLFLVPKLEKRWGEGSVGILTISSANLTGHLLKQVGISGRCKIESPDANGEFVGSILGNLGTLNPKISEWENVDAARRLVETNPEIRAIVLECTNMQPYAEAMERAINRPVYSVVSFFSDIFD